MTITLVAVICSGLLCQDVVVPTEAMVAGKADDPIPMQYTEIMCRTHGLIDALDWLSQQEQYKGWTLKPPVQCVPGKYESSKHA
jgi:hypothetical protein